MDNMGEWLFAMICRPFLNAWKIYLGTRYTNLLMFVIFFIHNDAGHVPCKVSLACFSTQGDCSYPVQPFIIMNYVRADRPSASLLLIDALLYPRRDCRLP